MILIQITFSVISGQFSLKILLISHLLIWLVSSVLNYQNVMYPNCSDLIPQCLEGTNVKESVLMKSFNVTFKEQKEWLLGQPNLQSIINFNSICPMGDVL